MAMALEMDGIIEYGVIDLVMWVVALSSKGKWSYNEPPFSKRKALYLLVNCMYCIFYVFPSTNIVLVFTSKLCGKKTPYTGHTGLFFSTCFLVQCCVVLCVCLVEQFLFLASKIFSHG